MVTEIDRSHAANPAGKNLNSFRFVFALILLLGTASATMASASEQSSIPSTVPQGGLLRGQAPAGSQVSLLQPGTAAKPLRLSADGWFVLGVGRDQLAPMQLQVSLPDGGSRLFQVTVLTRPWKIEQVRGVPESTVNPPPAIAARIAREQADVARARERDDDRRDFIGDFIWPVTGRVSGVYGSQRVYNGTPKSPHSGLDVAAAKGTPIRAPASGIISFAEPDLFLTGGTILIDHGHGLSSNFLHLSRLDVAAGDRVAQGQIIGLVGATGRATGPHLHWGMNWFQVRVDPQLLLDPAMNLPGSSAASAP